ncbi:MAG: serine/threonine-protein kinase, partial [Pirellulaceae bacterium]
MTHSTDNSPASSDPVWRGYDVLSLSQELAVDRLSDRFEGELREGRHPRIEEYLVQLPVSVRAFGFQQLLAVELELTSAAGRRLDASDLRCRFPEYVAVVDLELQRASTARSPANSQHSTDVTYQHGPAASAPASPNAIAPPAARDFQDIRGDCERALPATIGRYRILRVVGEGSFGRVYLAEDSQLGRQVALKVPRRGLFEGGATMDLFLREARTAAQLHHPGIVTLHDVGQDGDIVFIVQEYLAGKNLVAHVQATSMTVAQRVELMANVADAVAYAHQKNFVHRDLKPANILLG